jgi:hypothetical protein
MAGEAVVSATWRDERRRRIDRYGVVRALPWVVIGLVIFVLLAVPFYVALQVAVTFIGVNP